MTSFIVQKTINNGYGLAQSKDGKIFLIEEGLPQEHLTCKIIDSKRQYNIARIKKIIKPNPGRIEPSCPYIKECGGCDFQHCTYELQTEIKTEIIRDLLAGSSEKQLSEISANVADCLGCKKEFHYRQRIRLHIDDFGTLGFLKKKSNDVISINSCLIADKTINTCLTELKNCQEFSDLSEKTNQLELLHNPSTNMVTLLFHYCRKPRPADFKLAEVTCNNCPAIERIYFKGDNFPITKAASEENSSSSLMHYSFTLNGRDIILGWEVGSFCQVNLEQNTSMLETVLNFAAPKPEDNILDLYCGMGNFSISLASACKSVTGYEGQGAAIRAAKNNAEINQVSNTFYYKKPVHKACEELVGNNRKFDITIIDPPRQGAPDLAKQLANLTGKKLVYISCDPATLCRDLGELIQQGFTVKKIQPIDMFPQTHHIETVVLLCKT